MYIISHQRPGRLSPELLALAPTVLVAADELAAYRAAHRGVTILPHPRPGRGVAHARNQALLAARAAGLPALWMLDDDLYGFWRQDRRGRWCEDAATCLRVTEAAARAHPARPALAGMLPAYGRPKPDADLRPVLDRELYQCVYLDLSRLDATPFPIAYDETLGLAEDCDLCLQAMTRGFHTFRCAHMGYLSPLPGTAPGGLTATYADEDASRRSTDRMLAKWPHYCTPTRGGQRVTTHWHRAPGSLATPPEGPSGRAAPEHCWALPACESG